MASLVFNTAASGIANQNLNWESDTIMIMLLQGTGVPSKSDLTVTDVLTPSDISEVTATDYVRQTGQNTEIIESGNVILFDADNPVWATLGGASNNTISGALFYKFVTNDGDSSPVCYIDTNDLTTNGGQVTLTKDPTYRWFYINNPS
jgi:hypothetical protein